MAEICHVCKGTKIVTPVFNNRKMNCYACLSEPDAMGKRWPVGYININTVRCPVCEGGKSITTMGGMNSVVCTYCCGAGNVSESKIKADVEQINKQDTADAKTKADVDKSETDSGKRKRSKDGKQSSLGFSDDDIQEFQVSEQGSQEV